MKKFFCLILTVFLLRIIAIAQYVNLPAGGTITQNFDKMAKTATAQLPSGWRINKIDYEVNNPGIFSLASFSTMYSAGSSMSSTALGGIYNFGAGDPDTATDRAIGGLSTGSAAKSVSLLVDLYNNGNDTIGSYTISYDVEKYRNGSNSKGFSVNLYYSTDGAPWASASAFKISFPDDTNNKGATPVPISTQSIVSKTITLYNIPPNYHMVVPGSHFYLAWNYSVNSDSTNASTTNAQALGIDNIVISAKAKASPPALKAEALQGLGNICIGATSASRSFKLSGSRLNGSAIMVGPLDGYSFAATATESFSNTLSLSYNGSTLDTTVYVQFSPAKAQSYNGNIPVSGGGATPINVAVTGTGINTSPRTVSGTASSITQTGATINGSITNNGCSNITTYGIEYSTVNGFANGAGTSATSSNLSSGAFSSAISGLSAGTVYYYHAYASNSGGTSYGAQQSFSTTTNTTLPMDVVAIAATDTTTTSFTANWHPAPGAVNYRLDVATTADFIDDQTAVTLAKWTFPDLSADAVVDTASNINAGKTISAVGTKDPSFDAAGATTNVARATGWNNGSGSKYWQIEVNTTGQQNLLLSSAQRSSSTGPKDFKIQYKIGASGAWTDIPSPSVTVADNFTTGIVTNRPLPAACNNQASVFIRWIATSDVAVGGSAVGAAGVNMIDDITITGNQNTYVAGYKDLLVNDTSQSVTGLSPNTTYYYRVRATDGQNTSPNSNSVTVTTTEKEAKLDVVATNATDVMATSFTANWNSTPGAIGYRLDVATTNDFSGTYVPGYEDMLVNDTSQSVSGLSPNTTYYYRVRATDGQNTSPNSNSITVTTAEEENPVPPTTLLSFSGKEENNKNILRWITASENNNQGFDVQRSPDSIYFQSIGFIPSSAPDGNSTEAIEYTFNDVTSIDSQFYRLTVVNLDGTSGLSDVILIRRVKKIEGISIDGLYPNPASGSINLRINVPSPEKFTCSIVDSRGHILKQFPLNPEAGSNVFEIDITGVSPGTYHLKCISQSGTIAARKFIVR